MKRLVLVAVFALTACGNPEPAVAETPELGSAAATPEQDALEAAQQLFDTQVKARLNAKSTLRGLVRAATRDAKHPFNAAHFTESGVKLELVKGRVIFTAAGKTNGRSWEVSGEVSGDAELRELQVTRFDEV